MSGDIKAPKRSVERGFTLVEIMVALAVLLLVMLGLLTLLDRTANVTKTQSSMALMTENLRFTLDEMVRMIRMAGTGGVPLLAPGAGGAMNILAVNVRDNVAANTVGYGSPSRFATAGTDVLMLRGVIGGELYDLRGETAFVQTGGTTYQVSIPPSSPFTGNPQALVAPENGTPIIFTTIWELPVTLASGQTRYFSKYNIGLITRSTRDATDQTAPLVLDFKTTGDTDRETQIIGLNESGTFPPFQEEYVITAGFLDDLVFFISDNDIGEPSLFMFSAQDDQPEELVPNVASLQVALGCDFSPADGTLTEVGTAADDDEWFYNVVGDTPPTAAQIATLQEVRVSVVARGEVPDSTWPRMNFSMPENSPNLSPANAQFRHRSLTVRVTVRSHPPLTQG